MSFKRTKTIPQLFFFAGLLCGSCEYSATVSDELEQEPYFDMPAFVQQQLVLLDSLRPSVEIAAQVGGQKETESIKEDNIKWAEALQLFSDANINRPVLQGRYQVLDSSDQHQDWKVRIYRAKQPDEVEIPYLAVYYEDSLMDVQRIEVRFHEKNLLYSTFRDMSMQFKSATSGPQLTGYSSEGHQKMVLQDSVHYQLEASLNYL